jgi:hypothetical protein
MAVAASVWAVNLNSPAELGGASALMRGRFPASPRNLTGPPTLFENSTASAAALAVSG